MDKNVIYKYYYSLHNTHLGQLIFLHRQMKINRIHLEARECEPIFSTNLFFHGNVVLRVKIGDIIYDNS